MNLLLKVIDSPNYDIAVGSTKSFYQKGGSIGRFDNNDFVLPDPSKAVSKLHAFIHYRNSQYHLTDVSTNGVFFNDEDIAVAQSADNPRLIHEGDRIRIGEYLLEVHLETAAELEHFTPVVDSSSIDIESLLVASDNDLLLPTERTKIDHRVYGKFAGTELHHKLGIEDTIREAKHVAGDLNIDDFLNQDTDIARNIPSNSIDDLLDLDTFMEPEANHSSPSMLAPIKPVVTQERAQRLAALANELLVATDEERPEILAEINRLSK